MSKLAQAIEASKVPIVPSTVVSMAGGEEGEGGVASLNAFGLLMSLMATEKLGELTTAARDQDPEQAEMVATIKQQLKDRLATEQPPAAEQAPEA
jgi:hypothetical protein